MGIDDGDMMSEDMLAEQRAIEEQIKLEHVKNSMKKTYVVYWTHDVSKTNFKISSMDFVKEVDANIKKNNIRKQHLRLPQNDNAVMLASLGESIDSLGERGLIREL